MIQGVSPSVPSPVQPAGPGAPQEVPEVQRVLAALMARAPGSDALADLFRQSLTVALLEAMSRVPRPAPAAPGTPAPSPPPPASHAASSLPSPADPSVAASASPVAAPASAPLPPLPPPFPAARELDVIERTAARETIDPRFLQAIRRIENGGPGREFGVLSVPAPTYEDQARVAAETVHRNVERLEKMGKVAVDPATGLYTEEFVRFFSSRYAPVGAANDPTGLNQNHARNLIRVYAQLAQKSA
jgi:hypothetical protein